MDSIWDWQKERNEQFLNFWLKQLTIWRCHFLSQRETGKISFGPWIQKFHFEWTNLDVKQICVCLFVCLFVFSCLLDIWVWRSFLGMPHFVVCSPLYSLFSLLSLCELIFRNPFPRLNLNNVQWFIPLLRNQPCP